MKKLAPLQQVIIVLILLLWYKNKSKIYRKLFTTGQNYIYSWKNSEHLHFFETLTADSNNNYPTLENALFGAVSLTKNADINKYCYSGYVIRFDKIGLFSFPSGGFVVM